MSASDNEPDARKERYRRAVTFLESARRLPELTPSQIDRIERHLNRARPLRARRSVLMPALATLAVVLLAGAALAVTGTGLARLPGIGPLVNALFKPAPARSPAQGQPRPADETGARSPSSVENPQAPPPAAREPSPPPRPAAALPAQERTPALASRAAAAPSAESSAPAHAPLRNRRVAATVAASGGVPSGQRDLVEIPSARATPSAAAAPPVEAAPPAATSPSGTASATQVAAPPATAPPVRPAAALPPAPAPNDIPAPSAAATERPIVAESRSFAAALGRWHRERDAGAALAALDAHERRFPNGEIRLEARLLRAEILLAGGHEREGLALLDPLALTGLPRARELRTVRGELRIKFGRCQDGNSDLGAVLAEGASDPLARRARQALAQCP